VIPCAGEGLDTAPFHDKIARMPNTGAPGKLAGRVAVVTGGGGAIGRAIARALDGEGATVVVADLRRDAAAAVADELAHGDPIELDVASSTAWDAAVESLVERHGRLDVLVNAAATHLQALVEHTEDADWQRVVRTNVDSVFFGCRAVVRPMRRSGGGSIVNIVTGQFGVPYSSAYTASKFFVHGFSQCLALEVARDGTRVNCIAPGAIPNTGFERWYREKAELLQMPYDAFLQGALDSIPLHRFGSPEEIAAGALYLASDDAAYVTGHLLSIDGGFAGYAIALPREEE
jgi:meso-butanediol dehydrogenase/(S,S)-butanediol dehydrogenase/diacetyl reductase